MGKKIDLNKPRQNNYNIRKNNRNFYHNNIPEESNEQTEKQNTTNQTSNGNTLQYERSYELPEKANITIKFSKKAKKVFTVAIIGTLLMLLMTFIVIFSNEYDTSNNGDGLYTYGQTCTTVKVTDTENYIYDEEVSFDEYIAGVVAAETEGITDLEYLKLSAIIARTHFFDNASSSCTVDGNESFHKYMNVDDSPNSELIKQAVEETKDLIITQDEDLVGTDYCQGCVINKDSNYYYLRNNETNIQKIPIIWAKNNNLNGQLDKLYNEVDTSISNYEDRECPDNNNDYGLSQVGALYLITNENYSYKEVIEYYNGENVEIIKNELNFSETDGFINPTNSINCTSPYGKRIHPVNNQASFHTGIDIGIPGGSPIYAAKSGTINTVSKYITAINNCDYGYGNYVSIDHDDGTSTLYAHIKYGTIPYTITYGYRVSQGEKIGEVGSTGCSTGNHLHYEVRVNGNTVDPADYLDLTNATGTCKR